MVKKYFIHAIKEKCIILRKLINLTKKIFELFFFVTLFEEKKFVLVKIYEVKLIFLLKNNPFFLLHDCFKRDS